MLAWVAATASDAKLRLEPSAATGFPGALVHVWQSPVYRLLRERLARATHIVWTTGGAMLPDGVHQQLLADAASGRAS
jgi:D-serine dehydratase